MDKSRRKELTDQYKERPKALGVFAVRCAVSGEVWVSASRKLDTQQNGLFFSLRSGSLPNAAMLAAYKAHGAESFSYEVLETVDTEGLTPIGVGDLLKAREKHWREALNAKAALG